MAPKKCLAALLRDRRTLAWTAHHPLPGFFSETLSISKSYPGKTQAGTREHTRAHVDQDVNRNARPCAPRGRRKRARGRVSDPFKRAESALAGA